MNTTQHPPDHQHAGAFFTYVRKEPVCVSNLKTSENQSEQTVQIYLHHIESG